MRRRLEDLEERESGKQRQPARSPEDVYERIRREARESVEESLREGEEPIYRIAANGDVETADGRPINHVGDFIGALDERITGLDREIAELEVEEGNQQERRNA